MAFTKDSLEFLEHTADAHVRIHGSDLNQLFEHAARALLTIMVDPETVRVSESRSISLKADSLEELLVAWLNELLFLFESQELLVCKCQVAISGTDLQAEIHGEERHLQRHPVRTVVKSATYHQLHVSKNATGYTAELVFDL